MGKAAAKKGDIVQGVDIHIIMIPAPPGPPVPTPIPHNFLGMIDNAVSSNVKINGKPAATKGSMASCIPPHIPQGGPFQKPPSNKGTVMLGSATVKINGKPAARTNDIVKTCNDPSDAPTSKIITVSTVMIGG